MKRILTVLIAVVILSVVALLAFTLREMDEKNDLLAEQVKIEASKAKREASKAKTAASDLKLLADEMHRILTRVEALETRIDEQLAEHRLATQDAHNRLLRAHRRQPARTERSPSPRPSSNPPPSPEPSPSPSPSPCRELAAGFCRPT